jgi:hypothetical protein
VHWRRLSITALLFTVLAFCWNPASSQAASNLDSNGGEGSGPNDPEDVVVQSNLDVSDTFLVFLPFVMSWQTSACQCDHIIGQEVSTADARTNYFKVKPGDTVCIEGGSRGGLRLRNFRGTLKNPITFVNFQGQVVISSSTGDGILIQNSRYFRLTGSGTNGVDYGIKIARSPDIGVNAGYKSSNFEIDHIEVTGTAGSGIMAKTRAVCSDGSSNDYDYDGDGVKGGDPDDVVNRDTFTQFDSTFHDNYIHNVGMEGYYVGSSRYLDGRELSCTGGTEVIYDPVLVGVYLYDNIIADTGWDGLQVGSAVEDCGVYQNQISRDSQADIRYQQSGVMLNAGSVCNVYANFIKDGGGPGMYIQGSGGNLVYNNVIVNAGQNKPVGNNNGDAISIHDGSNPGNSLYVFNNTIVKPQNSGIEFSSGRGSDNKIQNNIIIDPGNYEVNGPDAYVQTRGYTNVVVTNNFTSQVLTDAMFSDPAADDFSIQWNSPAVDAGAHPEPGVVTTDYRGGIRPQGLRYDAGAYEYRRELP